MNDHPLFSFAILSYNNYKYIKEALLSLFTQDYPSIQLIISNDGSDDFDEEDLIGYINANRSDNIKQIIINNNERNFGTVKNVEYCRRQAEGEYIMYMAADDALYDSTVLSRFADEFRKLGNESLCICAKVAMCAHDLSDVKEYFPDEEGIEIIKNSDSMTLFSRLSHTFTIPTTGTCYRRSLYDKIGPYDEEYFIIEDAPLFIKMARNGIKFHWIEDFIAARHRDGGVSHGNTMKLTEGYKKYRYDEILCYKKEILPYKDLLTAGDLHKMTEKWNYLDRSYFDTFVYPNMSRGERIAYARKNMPFIFKSFLKRIKTKVVEYSFDEVMFLELRRIGIYSLIVYLMISFGFFNSVLQEKSQVFTMIFGWATLVTISLAIILYCLRIVYRVYLGVKYILFRK